MMDSTLAQLLNHIYELEDTVVPQLRAYSAHLEELLKIAQIPIPSVQEALAPKEGQGE